MSERYADRLRRAAEAAERADFAAIVVPPSADLVYLTGYDPPPLERPTLLVVRPGADPALLVPLLEQPRAMEVPGGALLEMVAWPDGADPYAEAARLLPSAGRIGVGDQTWGVHLLGLQAAVAGASFEGAAPALGPLRAIKDPDELEALRNAGAAADETFRQILDVSFAGRSEREVAGDLATFLVENGHTRADFTIVASGPNGASPHHEPGDRVIEPGDAVVLDFGGPWDGYFSDTSRTVAVEDLPPGFDEVYGLVRRAQDAAVDAARPGSTAQDVDRAARAVLDDAGLGERFVHRTGHGIGLEVHEAPYIVEGNETPLSPGMTFSVEPGVYLPGRFGVRIEDIVAVTADGVERLNRSTHDRQIVS